MGDGPWRALHLTVRWDPFLMREEVLGDTTDRLLPGKRASLPNRSFHIWQGHLETNLPIGEHTLEVRWTDWQGRPFFETHRYRVARPNPYP